MLGSKVWKSQVSAPFSKLKTGRLCKSFPFVFQCQKWHFGLDPQLLTHGWKHDPCGILVCLTTSVQSAWQTAGDDSQVGQFLGRSRHDLVPPAQLRGGPLPSAVHTTRHLLKCDQSTATPCSSYAGSSFQRAHKGWVQLNGLNGSRAPGLGGSDPLNGPHYVPWSQGATRTGLIFKRPFIRPVFLSEQRRNRHFHFRGMLVMDLRKTA